MPRKATHSRYRRPLFILIILLSLFLLGTVIVLSSVTWFFGVRNWALLSERDVPYLPHENWAARVSGNASSTGVKAPSWAYDSKWDGVVQRTETWDHLEGIEPLEGERIPRIIHQTWMNDKLPEKWRGTYQEHVRALPDFTHHLWTDSTARVFIQTHYPSFLATYDSYEYNIQRADAIRYFVLHRYGGIYMDLDIGIIRDPTPLLRGDWDVILAKTIPVGVSNDLMLSSKNNPFMWMVIHGLITFNHNYVTNYPTVMFSTGPMFLSAQYSLYTSSHPVTPVSPTLEIRVLPKSLYGKNALPEEAPHAFFSHFYGSSWHSDDSDFIIFLGRHGRGLMRFGLLLVLVGFIRLMWTRRGGVALKSRTGLRGLVISLSGDVREVAGQYGMLSLLPEDGEDDGSEISTAATSEGGDHSNDGDGESTGSSFSWIRRLSEGLHSPSGTYRGLVGDSPSTTPGADGRGTGPSLPTINPSGGRRRARSRSSRTGVLFFLPAFLTSTPPPDAQAATFTPIRPTNRDRAYSSGRLRSASAATPPVLPTPTISELGNGPSSALKEKRGRATPPPIYQHSDTASSVLKHDGEEWDSWGEDGEDHGRSK